MQTRRTLIIATLLGLALPTAAVLAEDVPEGGRPLADGVRAMLWTKACDVAEQDYNIDCAATPEKCTFKRADGAAFAPLDSPWGRSFGYSRYAAPNTVLAPVAKANGAAIDDSAWDVAEPAFAFLSGLPLMMKGEDDGVVRLTPSAIAWIQRELIPTRDVAMCGQTAGALYDAGFRTTARASALAWEHVKRSGKLRGLTPAKLQKEHDARKGATWSMCEKFSRGAAKKTFDERMLLDECQFWLRRGAVGQAEPVAAVLGAVLERFDADFFKAHAKAFAQPKATKKGR
ncbi:MAG: hypothetical protein KC635_27995 [Myxococcales bacterium]|nr:hypothetical protein [Myxococcales bacterium]